MNYFSEKEMHENGFCDLTRNSKKLKSAKLTPIVSCPPKTQPFNMSTSNSNTLSSLETYSINNSKTSSNKCDNYKLARRTANTPSQLCNVTTNYVVGLTPAEYCRSKDNIFNSDVQTHLTEANKNLFSYESLMNTGKYVYRILNLAKRSVGELLEIPRQRNKRERETIEEIKEAQSDTSLSSTNVCDTHSDQRTSTDCANKEQERRDHTSILQSEKFQEVEKFTIQRSEPSSRTHQNDLERKFQHDRENREMEERRKLARQEEQCTYKSMEIQLPSLSRAARTDRSQLLETTIMNSLDKPAHIIINNYYVIPQLVSSRSTSNQEFKTQRISRPIQSHRQVKHTSNLARRENTTHNKRYQSNAKPVANTSIEYCTTFESNKNLTNQEVTCTKPDICNVDKCETQQTTVNNVNQSKNDNKQITTETIPLGNFKVASTHNSFVKAGPPAVMPTEDGFAPNAGDNNTTDNEVCNNVSISANTQSDDKSKNPLFNFNNSTNSVNFPTFTQGTPAFATQSQQANLEKAQKPTNIFTFGFGNQNKTI